MKVPHTAFLLPRPLEAKCYCYRVLCAIQYAPTHHPSMGEECMRCRLHRERGSAVCPPPVGGGGRDDGGPAVPGTNGSTVGRPFAKKKNSLEHFDAWHQKRALLGYEAQGLTGGPRIAKAGARTTPTHHPSCEGPTACPSSSSSSPPPRGGAPGATGRDGVAGTWPAGAGVELTP